MNANRSELRKAMKEQKITFTDLQDKLGHSRQMISRAADSYENGERISEDIEREFNLILANHNAGNFPGGELCSKELIEQKLSECRSRYAGVLTELKEIIELSETDLSKLSDPSNFSELDSILPELGENYSAGSREKELIDALVALRMECGALFASMDESGDTDALDALWESTVTINKRPILYHEGHSISFCTVSGPKAMVYAQYLTDIFDIDLTVNAHVELFVLTESEIFPIRSIKASNTMPGYPGLVAEFEIIPDFKYFYRIRYEGISATTMEEKYLAEMGEEEYASLPQELKMHLAEPSMVELPGEYTRFHPLK